MLNLKIDTDAVAYAARVVQNNNRKIDDDFLEMRDAIARLHSDWDSVVSENMLGKFQKLESCYFDARHNEMNNFVIFLNKQVKSGYEQVESANKSLANAFK